MEREEWEEWEEWEGQVQQEEREARTCGARGCWGPCVRGQRRGDETRVMVKHKGKRPTLCGCVCVSRHVSACCISCVGVSPLPRLQLAPLSKWACLFMLVVQPALAVGGDSSCDIRETQSPGGQRRHRRTGKRAPLVRLFLAGCACLAGARWPGGWRGLACLSCGVVLACAVEQHECMAM